MNYKCFRRIKLLVILLTLSPLIKNQCIWAQEKAELVPSIGQVFLTPSKNSYYVVGNNEITLNSGRQIELPINSVAALFEGDQIETGPNSLAMVGYFAVTDCPTRKNGKYRTSTNRIVMLGENRTYIVRAQAGDCATSPRIEFETNLSTERECSGCSHPLTFTNTIFTGKVKEKVGPVRDFDWKLGLDEGELFAFDCLDNYEANRYRFTLSYGKYEIRNQSNNWLLEVNASNRVTIERQNESYSHIWQIVPVTPNNGYDPGCGGYRENAYIIQNLSTNDVLTISNNGLTLQPLNNSNHQKWYIRDNGLISPVENERYNLCFYQGELLPNCVPGNYIWDYMKWTFKLIE